ncbi:hypothetical protein KC19_VG157200 [Ceratodon purpureus]|uniref:Secreted protein n=1 Tax=Ceratodon purpureus TaxID=3225 RepID=A0A8T0HQZ6_CERPU|nr:hypothetical protein KC19_VG157200 [Ceratodon purpureus]
MRSIYARWILVFEICVCESLQLPEMQSIYASGYSSLKSVHVNRFSFRCKLVLWMLPARNFLRHQLPKRG